MGRYRLIIYGQKKKKIEQKRMYERYKYTSPQGKILYRYRMPLIAPINFEKRESLHRWGTQGQKAHQN